jgi:sulfatase maturation enzyme AslB (radical SAM superfamily)
MNKTDIPAGFCVVPWLSLYIQNDGKQNVCAYYQNEHFYGLEPDHFINNKTPAHPLNNSELLELRRKMLENKIPDGCEHCHDCEKNNGISHRQQRNQESSHLIPEILQAKEQPQTISHMELRVGNLCNLRCRMCDPSSTMKWIKDWNSLHPEQYKIDEKKLKSAAELAWCEKPEYWNALNTYTTNLKVLEFAGGEPFYSKKVLEFLTYLVKTKASHNISISFITNLTILPDEFLALFPKFQQITFTVSLDGISSLNDYIRTGSIFNVIDENLRKLDRDFELLNLKRVGINTTLQVYNSLGIKELVDYLNQFKNIDNLPHLSPLFYPEYFAIEVLPQKIKEIAKIEIEEIINSFSGREDWLIKSFKHALQLLKTPTDEKVLAVLRQETLKLDQHDNKSLREVSPELYLNLFL